MSRTSRDLPATGSKPARKFVTYRLLVRDRVEEVRDFLGEAPARVGEFVSWPVSVNVYVDQRGLPRTSLTRLPQACEVQEPSPSSP